ncbi:MAG: sugar phosphate isomerase/epimerase family protein [Tropicimonas sp.]|uniref:sugar phosphate isomerase/epimerase family protein n=1 Tax=Tropicimonas sp. TaxID=2067044 RepID=UPI003A83F488
MEFGIHTFVWNDGQSQKDIEQAMEATRAAGYAVLELPGLDPARFDLAGLVRRAEALDLKLAASAGLPPACDVTSPDPETVRRGEAFLLEAVGVARDLGCSQMSGPIFSAHRKFDTLPDRDGWQRSADVLARVAGVAKEAGVALCLELVNRYETNLINTVAQGLAYIADTGSDNIFLHLDTFHMNIEEADPVQAIRLAGRHIGYFHVGESNRGHLGSGCIDFAPVFDALLEAGYDGIVSIEAFNPPALNDHLKAVCAIWRDVIGDNAAFARHARTFMEMQHEAALRRAAAYGGA